MNDFSNPFLPRHIKKFYPHAVQSKTLLDLFLLYAAKSLKLAPDKLAFATSVCSDEINQLEQPDLKGMIGTFFLGGLDGSPFVGLTGLGAFLHHVPDDGAALLFYGPHVGITEDYKTHEAIAGKVVRPGQDHPSDCCGALAKALSKLNGTVPPVPGWPDYQQETIETILFSERTKILAESDPSKQFIVASDVILADSQDRINDLIRKVHTGKGAPTVPLYAFGGIVINQDKSKPSYISLQYLKECKDGNSVDLLNDFIDVSRDAMLSTEERIQIIDQTK